MDVALADEIVMFAIVECECFLGVKEHNISRKLGMLVIYIKLRFEEVVQDFYVLPT